MKTTIGTAPQELTIGKTATRASRRLLLALALASTALVGAACGPAYVSTGFEVGPPSPSYQNIYYEARDGYVWVEGRYD